MNLLTLSGPGLLIVPAQCVGVVLCLSEWGLSKFKKPIARCGRPTIVFKPKLKTELFRHASDH